MGVDGWVSLHSWQRGANSLFYEDPPYIAHPPLFNFVHPTPTPNSLSLPTPTPTALSIVLFLWLNGRSRYIFTVDVLFNDNKDLHMSSLWILVPEGPWCVFYATSRQVYWGLTHCDFLLVLWFDITHTHIHTHKNTQHTLGPVDWHTQIHHLLCAHGSFFYYIKWLN